MENILRSRRYAVATVSAAAILLGLTGLAAPGAAQAAAGGTSPAHQAVGQSAAAAGAASGPAATAAPVTLPSGAKEDCPKPKGLLQEQCQGFTVPKGKSHIGPKSSAKSGAAPQALTTTVTPSQLQSAYGITSDSTSDGSGQTVAIVDAYGDSHVASDLEQYRSNYGLAGCANASCLHVYNETGGTSLPADPTGNNGGWMDETAMDVEMVSAICPNCGIDLFQANSASTPDLGTAEKAAVAKGDKFISNSWAGADFAGESAYDGEYFNNPGVASVFASGDSGYTDYGYEASYPGSSQFVTSAGGTELNTDSSGNWTQTVWNDSIGSTGSGCSSGEGKPSWQMDTGCANRTQNDVSAIASAPAGLAIYSSGPGCGGGWCGAGGTSAAAPELTAMYALAGTPAANTYPSSYLYAHASSLAHITSGSNGSCESTRAYLCNAGSSESDGYNGPAGLGVTNGSLAPFTAPSGNTVTLPSPESFELQSGKAYTLTNPASPADTSSNEFGAVDSDSSQTTFTYSASNLPSGLSLNASTGEITGTVTTPEDQAVKVTATDSTGASATIAFNISTMGSMTTSYHAVSGRVPLNWDSMCLDDSGNSSKAGAKAIIWTCSTTDKAQNDWSFQTQADPSEAGFGQLKINGLCLAQPTSNTGNGASLTLQACTSGTNEQWGIVGAYGELVNQMSGRCLEDPGWSKSNGAQLDVWSCSTGANQNWTLPASPIGSAMYNRCLNDSGNSTANGAKVISYTCNGASNEHWSISADGTIRINGKCLDDKSYGISNGTGVDLWACGGGYNQQWELNSAGQIESANAEKCLSIPDDTQSDAVTLQDCTGKRGEVWTAS